MIGGKRNRRLQKIPRINFKVHGRTPISDHRMGQFWSLSIKLKGKDNLFGYRRFSLITNNRLTDAMLVPGQVAQKKGLISHVHYPARLAFNNTTVEKVYVENKFDPQFFELNEKPEYHIFSYPYFQYANETSMIYTGYHVLPRTAYDFDNLETIFKEIFLQRGTEIESNRGVLDRYYEINRAIITNTTHGFEDFFDVEYLAKYEAVRAALGLNGHGSLNDNLHVFSTLVTENSIRLTRITIFQRIHLRRASPTRTLLNRWKVSLIFIRRL